MANTQQAASGLGLDLDQDANATPSDEEVGTVLARIKAARAAASDPVDLQQFQDAQNQAAQLYKDKADRSEWLSVADKIGAAVTKFAAASAGQKAGVDLSHIDTGPGYDYNGTVDRASKDYSTELGRIRGNKEDALKQQRDEFGLGEKALDTVTKEKAQRSSDARQAKSLEASDARQKTSLEASDARQRNSLDAAQKEADRRERIRRDEDSAKEERFNKSKDIKDLDLQEKEAGNMHTARQQLFNNLMSDNDLGGKTRDKLQATYGKLAGAAGVDLGELQDKLAEQETTRPGWLGGKTAKEEKAAKQAILNSELTETKNLLDGIKAKKEALLRNRASTATQAAPADTTPPPPDLVTLKGPSGTVAKMTKDKAQKYLSQPGYSIVPN